jgi:hypothetical protein
VGDWRVMWKRLRTQREYTCRMSTVDYHTITTSYELIERVLRMERGVQETIAQRITGCSVARGECRVSGIHDGGTRWTILLACMHCIFTLLARGGLCVVDGRW